ncbi:hypothetical protein [Kribbella sp. NPDC003557]|uniref:hypothetical protein n=1 Tax=Kribbella sp. NPDC003557 TaxID=3154449 RepID=UPI0033A2525C
MARLDNDSLDVMMGWLNSGQAKEGDREILVDLVDLIERDEWMTRWFCELDPSEGIWLCQPRSGLHILLEEEPDQDGEWAVNVLSIYDDDTDHQPGANDLPF